MMQEIPRPDVPLTKQESDDLIMGLMLKVGILEKRIKVLEA